MATRAYVLIECSPGKTRDVAAALRGAEGVKSVDQVTGPYDVIVVAEAKDLNSIGDLVTTKVRPIRGVNRTVTCLTI